MPALAAYGTARFSRTVAAINLSVKASLAIRKRASTRISGIGEGPTGILTRDFRTRKVKRVRIRGAITLKGLASLVVATRKAFLVMGTLFIAKHVAGKQESGRGRFSLLVTGIAVTIGSIIVRGGTLVMASDIGNGLIERIGITKR